MNKGRKWIFRIGALAIVLVVAAVMFVIGRGHTVYFDNRELAYNGKTVAAPYKIVVSVDGEQVAKLYDKERGMTDTMGQKFSMVVRITQEKGGEEKTSAVSMNLPYNMDGIILNIPAMMAGLPEEAYLTEFIQAPTEEPEEEPAEGEDDMMGEEELLTDV